MAEQYGHFGGKSDDGLYRLRGILFFMFAVFLGKQSHHISFQK